MARKKKRRRCKSKQVSALTMFGFATNFFKKAPSGRTIYDMVRMGKYDTAMFDAREIFLGIDADGRFKPQWIIDTWARPVIGYLGSLIATRIGLNKQMQRIPVLGKFLKL